jgi:fucose 4-O-acetylase-like acetyltransferase
MAAHPRSGPHPVTRSRLAYADNLKVVLGAGVIVAHATMAWTGLDTWVLTEPSVGEPLKTVLVLAELVGALFGMALFFLIAGAFTPASVVRKGLARFLADRTVRLGVPTVFFALVLSPLVEYVDSDNVGWDRGFGAFVLRTWWPPVPGPTWFLAVLLLFSTVYSVTRTWWPARAGRTRLRGRHLVAAGLALALGSYAVRLAVPLGEEVWHLALGQAPAWVVGFVLGVVGGERGWFDRIDPAMTRGLFRVAWAAVAGCVVVVVGAGAVGADIERFGGGGSWPSLVVAGLEAALVVAMSTWLLDVFRRRVDHQGPLARGLGRAAFAAYLVHQVVLVGLVLATRYVPWPPEAEYLVATVLGVVATFGVAALVVRLPGVSRIV